ATLGHNYFSDKTYIQQSEGLVLAVPGFYNIKNATQVTTTEDTRQQKSAGAFADIRLAYKEFLFLNLSGRNDWSSTLPKKMNSFFHPAASMGLEVPSLPILTVSFIVS